MSKRRGVRTPEAVRMDAETRNRRDTGLSLVEVVVALLILLVGLLAISRLFVSALLAEKKAANRQAGAAAVQQIVEEMRQAGVPGLSGYAGNKVLWRKTTYDQQTGQVRKVKYMLLPATANPGGGQNERFERLGTFNVTVSDYAAKVKKARLETVVGGTKTTQSRVVVEALFAEE